jgi:hypothetical protein
MSPETSSKTAEIAPDGANIVMSLLRRQDQVLSELDELNARVEATIKSITEARQQESATQQELNTSLETAISNDLVEKAA